MKVICIESKINNPLMPHLIEGKDYTAINEMVYEGRPYYELSEIPPINNAKCWYEKRLFIFLSDIDETSFIREYNKQKV
jgi:hypothetical protein